jgi:hypothetical protein
LREGVFFAMVVVPELGHDKDVFTLDESFVDRSLDALSRFSFVLVVVRTIEQTVADFDSLGGAISRWLLEMSLRILGPTL